MISGFRFYTNDDYLIALFTQYIPIFTFSHDFHPLFYSNNYFDHILLGHTYTKVYDMRKYSRGPLAGLFYFYLVQNNAFVRFKIIYYYLKNRKHLLNVFSEYSCYYLVADVHHPKNSATVSRTCTLYIMRVQVLFIGLSLNHFCIFV